MIRAFSLLVCISVSAGGSLYAQSAVDLSDESSWPRCDTRTPPLLRVGSMDGDPAYLFDEVSDATFVSEERIAVLDRNSQQVRLFDSSGRLLRRLGRKGEGPGEFRDPIELEGLGSDSLAVWDWGLNRITVFPIEGGDPRTIRLDPPIVNPTRVFGILQDAGSYVVGAHDFQPVGYGPGEGDQDLQLLLYSSDGRLADTIHVLPYGQLLWVDEAQREVGDPRFGARGVFHVDGDAVYISTGADPEISRLTVSSMPEPVARWLPPDRRVRDRDIVAQREAQLSRVSSTYLRERVLREWERLPVADQFPAVSRILVDGARLWIERYPRPGTDDRTWWLFEADGDFECAITFADGFEALEFWDDRVLGVVKDEFAVEYVEVRTFRRF